MSDYNNGELLGSYEQKTSMSAKPTFLTSIFIPIGVNFRLSKTKEIWDQMNLFAKADVGLEAVAAVNRRVQTSKYGFQSWLSSLI